MSNETQHTPADAREPTDAQINVWSIIRSALSRAWALSRPWAVADRPQVTSEVVARLDAIAAECEREVLALLRTPRGEEEAWRAFLDALDEFEAAANLWVDPIGPTAADMERLRQARQRVIECARVLGVCRSEAQGEERASEYGALLAFADAISDAVWGGERAWEQDGGLERLSQKVRRWAKERAALRSDAQGELVKEAVALIDEAVSEIAG